MFRPALLPLFLLISAPALSPGAPAGEPQTEWSRIANTDPAEDKRLAALQKLEAAGALNARQIYRSITDTAPAVRALALKLGARFVESDPALEPTLLALRHDGSQLVRIQLLESARAFRSPQAQGAILHILMRDLRFSEVRQRVLEALGAQLPAALRELLKRPDWQDETPERRAFLTEAAEYLRKDASQNGAEQLRQLPIDFPDLARWQRNALGLGK